MTTAPVDKLTSAINCSTVYAGMSFDAACARAVSEGYRAVEFWWPFAAAVPSAAEMDDFVGALERHDLRLVAMNLWGGDMAAGQRGLLDVADMPDGHLDAVIEIARRTGLKRSNTLLGRSGQFVTEEQKARLVSVVKQLAQVGVRPLIEPLSGMDDYPIVDPWQADALAKETGAGVLADFYHFAVNGVDVDAWLADVQAGKLSYPEHVQIADVPGRGAPGTGQAPLREWVTRLRAIGYEGDVVGEWL